MGQALTFMGITGPTGSLSQAQGRWRTVTLVAFVNWLLLIVAVGHTGWVDGTGRAGPNPRANGLDFHFGLSTFRTFSKETMVGNVHTLLTTYYPSDDALRVANAVVAANPSIHVPAATQGTLDATLGLLVTCIVLQTVVLVALGQQRFGFLAANPVVRWAGRVAKPLILLFSVSAVGAFANAGYLEVLKAAYDPAADSTTVYGGGYGTAVAAIVLGFGEAALLWLWAGALNQVGEYYSALGVDGASGGIAAAAAGIGMAAADGNATKAAAPAAAPKTEGGVGASSYQQLTPEERAAILAQTEQPASENTGGYQGSSAYAAL